jgi:circadian clock protein KaiB
MELQLESNGKRIVLRLYIAGGAPHSVQALAHLKALLAAGVSSNGNHPQVNLEVVDVLEEPLRALDDGVFVTPTLVVLAPTPARIIGSLSEREKVARLLGFE